MYKHTYTGEDGQTTTSEQARRCTDIQRHRACSKQTEIHMQTSLLKVCRTEAVFKYPEAIR